jgi:hypothetical protein
MPIERMLSAAVPMESEPESPTAPRDLKAIFFDAGGTLIHLDSSYICGALKEKLDIELSQDPFKRAQFLGMSRVAELVALRAGSTEKLKREFYSTLLPEVGVPATKLMPLLRAC